MGEEERRLLLKLAEALSGPWSPLGIGERYEIAQIMAAVGRVVPQKEAPHVG